MRVLAELTRPAFIYLIWIGSDGKAFPLYPWIEGDWTARPEVENPLKLVSLPEQANFGWPMEGPAGMETLVLVARESPLPKQVDLKALFDDEPLPPQVMQDSKSLVLFANGKSVTAQQDRLRAPIFFNPQRLHDPVLDAQRMIDSRLKPHFQLISAISFAKVEKE